MADAQLLAIARDCRVQILRMLAHAGSGHPGGSGTSARISALVTEGESSNP